MASFLTSRRVCLESGTHAKAEVYNAKGELREAHEFAWVSLPLTSSCLLCPNCLPPGSLAKKGAAKDACRNFAGQRETSCLSTLKPPPIA